MDFITKLRKESDMAIKQAMEESMKLYEMEAYVDLVDEISKIMGQDTLVRPNVFYDSSICFYYDMTEEESFRFGKVVSILEWCVDNLEYTNITESSSDVFRTWRFCNDITISISFNYTGSATCNMVETGEYDKVPITKLVCE